MAKKAASAASPADAIALLKADHRAVEALFDKFEKASGAASKKSIAQQICLELSIHTTIEEELFYPGVKTSVDDSLYREAYVEHDGAKMLIAEILAGDPGDAFYDAKVKVLSEDIRHHVKEEERRGGMFAQARKGDIDLKALGVRMAARKAELKKVFRRDGVPMPESRSLAGARMKVGQPVA